MTTTAKPRNSVARVVAIGDGICCGRPGVRRKRWLVQAIREQGIDLASSSDSGELRRVSAEYVLEHLQLAYASTVHGIQGETADASIVGPDVDAAGLYVGLTRGRIRNVAIAVARTDDVAREAAAQSMMRGTPELTMRDAVVATEGGAAGCGAESGRGDRVGQAEWVDARSIHRVVMRPGLDSALEARVEIPRLRGSCR